MQFKSQISTAQDCQTAANELTGDNTGMFDLGIVFASPSANYTTKELLGSINQKISIRNTIGCTCAGIIGSKDEIERRSAAVLFLADLPDVRILPFSVNQTQLEGLKTQEDWYRYFEIYPNENPVFIALPDPFQFDADRFLDGLNMAYPKCPVVGGLASAATSPGENTLILNGEEYNDGLIGVVLTGNIRVNTVVSQGCKPIAKTFIVTKADGNVIYSLAGRPFIEVLKEVLAHLPANDQVLAQEAIFVGIDINEYQHDFKRGDFLIRGLMGIHKETGAGVVADYVQAGQTVQFHLRDAKSASDDLHELLTSQKNKDQSHKPCGALVFCCNGRGEFLFHQKNHDIEIIQQYLGPIPAGGFFCAGEIGPVGENNFLHGFTNSIALFYPRH